MNNLTEATTDSKKTTNVVDLRVSINKIIKNTIS